ncbi:MAG TPA: tyrosine-type recombinase/integrase [Candidatus Tumulicola sp.]|nr:tyrosine-type recombinase/integrase [Candidatus Tumulicola sp.]
MSISAYIGDLELFGAFLAGAPVNESPHGKLWPRLSTATTRQVRQFVQELTGTRGYKPSAIRRKLAALRSFYGFLGRVRKREDNPAADVGRPVRGKLTPSVLNEREASILLRTSPEYGVQWLKSRDRAIMEMLYATGVRRAEIAALNVEDVDLESRTMRVIGKGRRQRLVVFNQTTADALRTYLGVRPRSLDSALFSGRTRRRLSPRHVWEIFNRIYKTSKLRVKASPHKLRRFFAVHVLERGVSPINVQELLRHEGPPATQVYADVSSEHNKQLEVSG